MRSQDLRAGQLVAWQRRSATDPHPARVLSAKLWYYDDRNRMYVRSPDRMTKPSKGIGYSGADHGYPVLVPNWHAENVDLTDPKWGELSWTDSVARQEVPEGTRVEIVYNLRAIQPFEFIAEYAAGKNQERDQRQLEAQQRAQRLDSINESWGIVREAIGAPSLGIVRQDSFPSVVLSLGEVVRLAEAVQKLRKEGC